MSENRHKPLTESIGLFVAIIACAFGIIGTIAAILVIPEVRVFLGLDQTHPTSVIENGNSSRTLDCSLTTELDPWPNPTEITINPNRDEWIQADFWSPLGQLISGYDEISVIFEPSLRTTISNVAGIAWKYDRTWSKEDVEWCTNKHIQDSWNIRHKKLILITPAELCSIVSCR